MPRADELSATSSDDLGHWRSHATKSKTIFVISDTNTEDIDALKNNSVNPVEFQYKDELVRSTIEKVETDVNTIKIDVNEIKEQLNKMDERLYEISRK